MSRVGKLFCLIPDLASICENLPLFAEAGDILICGKCRRLFFSVDLLLEHKKTTCRPLCNCMYESRDADHSENSAKGGCTTLASQVISEPFLPNL